MSLLDAIVVLATELPDPGKLAIVALTGTVGTFLGGLLARLRHLPSEKVSQMTGTGTWLGIGIGLATWFGAIAIDRL